MSRLEDRIVAAMARIAEVEPNCDRHMFVFPVSMKAASLGRSLVGSERIIEDDVVMLICRDPLPNPAKPIP
jgi:hypothetical protein